MKRNCLKQSWLTTPDSEKEIHKNDTCPIPTWTDNLFTPGLPGILTEGPVHCLYICIIELVTLHQRVLFQYQYNISPNTQREATFASFSPSFFHRKLRQSQLYAREPATSGETIFSPLKVRQLGEISSKLLPILGPSPAAPESLDGRRRGLIDRVFQDDPDSHNGH